LFSLSGKTALVTGASRGIGYMIAAGLLKRGVRYAPQARISRKALQRCWKSGAQDTAGRDRANGSQCRIFGNLT
jgi:NAD(P)-dependent dehydrogenase (short-subunit alcohol dehydrogenase family)